MDEYVEPKFVPKCAICGTEFHNMYTRVTFENIGTYDINYNVYALCRYCASNLKEMMVSWCNIYNERNDKI